MEWLKKKYRGMGLLQSFIFTVFITFASVTAASLLAVFACLAIRNSLIPDPGRIDVSITAKNEAGETKNYTVTMHVGEHSKLPSMLVKKDENGEPVPDFIDPTSVAVALGKLRDPFSTLTPKKKILYRLSGAAMVVLPFVISVCGVLVCGFTFYRRKLCRPLKLLSDATEQIVENDLDFKLSYDAEDEMGKLCRSFEKMRQALYENNREMWKMIEERRAVQASVAHDLRNPIAIIEGYTEYLQLNLRAGSMSSEKIEETVDNIEKAAKRLEQYTESVRKIDQLDDIEIHRTPVSKSELIADITEDLSLMASAIGIELRVTDTAAAETFFIDTSVLYRVLENIVGNSLRFAEKTVSVSFASENGMLEVTVSDDGIGYPEEILKSRNKLLLPMTDEMGHCGMGLTISRILCRKHGGKLELSNNIPHGAVTKIFFSV